MAAIPCVDDIVEIKKEQDSINLWAYGKDGEVLGEIFMRDEDTTFEEMQESGYDFVDGFGTEYWVQWA